MVRFNSACLLYGMIFLVFVSTLGGWILGHHDRRDGDMVRDTGPVVVAIKQLGEIHTISLNFEDVLHKDTYAKAPDWARDIPGSDAMTRIVTHNEALVVAKGTVDAGIDLREISAEDVSVARLASGKMGIRVHLPVIKVYTPNVSVHVEALKSGLVWGDDNIVPRAEADAATQFAAAAETENIREQAKTSCIATLKKLMESLRRSDDVEFYF